MGEEGLMINQEQFGEIRQNCIVCKTELGKLEIDCHRDWHYDCQNCVYCKSLVTEDILRDSLAKNRPVSHESCHEKEIWKSFGLENIQITQEHLNFLNKWLLTPHPLENITLETCYSLLRDLQQAAANVTIALNRKKDNIKIIETENWRAHVEFEQEERKEKKRQTEEKKIRLQEERSNPQLRNRRKALEGLMQSFGMTEEQAEAMLKSQEQTQ